MEQMRLNVSNFSVSESKDNPDLMRFTATACYLDTPTDGTPCGGISDYKTVISSDADIQSLVGMGVNCLWSDGWFAGENLKDHNPWFKIGVITDAKLEGNAVNVEGHLWKVDFPDICDTIECAKESLGCSVELYFDGVRRDDGEKLLYGQGGHFTGMAILYKTKAAFQNTKFMCSLMKGQEGENMTQEEMNALTESFGKMVDAKMEEFCKKQEERLQSIEEKLSLEEKLSNDEKANEPAFDTEAISKAVVDGVVAAFAQEGKEPERKTVLSFAMGNPDGTTAQLPAEKTMEQKCSEVASDKNLSDEQKWAAKLAIWNARSSEKAI